MLRALERSESAKERAQLRDERLVEKDLRGMTQGRPKAALGKGKARSLTLALALVLALSLSLSLSLGLGLSRSRSRSLSPPEP